MVIAPMKVQEKKNSGFTLIEALVSVGILAILSVVTVYIINPPELLRQGRDVARATDIQTLNKAVGLYYSDAINTGGNFSLGSSSVTYLSLPDPSATSTAGTDCSSIGFPSGGFFHCAASSTLKKTNGLGWIPINFSTMTGGAPIGALPVDSVNQSSTNLYYTYNTDGTTFKLRAVPESQKYLAQSGIQPNLFTDGTNQNLAGGSGWVLVAGNSRYGTPNFWVMKYLAVCSDNKGNYLNDHPTQYQGYLDIGLNCIAANGRQIAALPGGEPITNLSHPVALQYCANVGAHLLTNDEWMTMADDIANQVKNWSGGTVGSGAIYSGHNDTAPLSILPADSNDANGYAGEINVGGNQRRTLYLSNGSVVWDMGGNLWEHVQRSTKDQGDTLTAMTLPSCAASTGGWAFCEFPAINWTGSTVSQASVAPLTVTWNSTNGVGEVWTYAGTQGTTVLFRGGTFNNYAAAGIYSLELDSMSTSNYETSGFRCAR
jgi:prepilin-type N-terminal cleavage/methylation domain-containing protein